MSTAKMDQCAMPNCHNYTEQGKRLCAKHAVTGKDLRIPVYVLDLGLEKIYETLRRQRQGFSVETILDILDPGYDQRIDGINCKNALAKLFRSLRANGFLVKKGHVNGFVVYELGQGWNISQVTIEDEPPVPSGNILDTKLVSLTNKLASIEHQVTTVLNSQNAAIVAMREQIHILTNKINSQQHESHAKQSIDIESINKQLAEMREQIKALQHNNKECPVAKLRQQMHVMLRG